MTTDRGGCGESVRTPGGYLALVMRPPHSLLHGVSSDVLHSGAFVGFVTGCKH
jgi:hypothetical protein